jgi:hypothetical protein
MIRQLALRERVQPAGKISHENVFFRQDGSPIRNLMTPYDCRRWTLKGLKSRYRPPYNARQSWVSWLLMIGKNLLWVANNHRHSVPTMPTDYAAWIEGVAKDAGRYRPLRRLASVMGAGGRPGLEITTRSEKTSSMIFRPPSSYCRCATAFTSASRNASTGYSSIRTRFKPTTFIGWRVLRSIKCPDEQQRA